MKPPRPDAKKTETEQTPAPLGQREMTFEEMIREEYLQRRLYEKEE